MIKDIQNHRTQLSYLMLALIISLLAIGRIEGQAFQYCEKQTKVAKTYCLAAHNIK